MADGFAFSAYPGDLHLTSSVRPELELYYHSRYVNDSAKQFHVAMVPYPVQGQINPMLRLAEQLTAQHDDIMVTLVTNKYNHDRIQRASTSAINSNLHLAWVDNGLPCDFDYGDLSGARLKEFCLSVVNMKEPLKQLLQSFNHNHNTPRVSCVLSGTLCPWAQTAAAELHIPTLLFWTQSAALFSIYHHMPLLVANGFFPYDNRRTVIGCNEDPVRTPDPVNYIPGLPPLLPSSFPTLLRIDDFSDPSLANVKEQFSLVPNCKGVIINSFEELEKDTYQALQQELPCPISLVGPLLPSPFLDDTDRMEKTAAASLLQKKSACIQWLDGKPKQSVLYISFGSIFNPSACELKAIAMGIKSCKQPYLWVMRPQSFFQDVSDDVLPKHFVEDTKDYGLIIPWAPQVQVLSHPSVGGFLTHSGWNSTLESLSMGVPMISYPFLLDQPTNSTYVCDIWKVGMTLKRQGNGELKSEDVEKVVRILLQEEEGLQMRERARKFGALARQAVQAQGSSHARIEELIQALRNHAKPTAPASFHDHGK